MRDECLLPPKLNRHQRKVRLKQQMAGSASSSLTSNVGSISTRGNNNSATSHPLLEKPSIHAIIASGTGPDGRAEAKRLRKKRRMIGRSVAVVVISVLIALAKNYFSSSSGKSRSRSRVLPLSTTSKQQQQQQLTRDVLKDDAVAGLLLANDSDNVDKSAVTEDEENNDDDDESDGMVELGTIDLPDDDDDDEETLLAESQVELKEQSCGDHAFQEDDDEEEVDVEAEDVCTGNDGVSCYLS